jgi:hypothetical protein
MKALKRSFALWTNVTSQIDEVINKENITIESLNQEYIKGGKREGFITYEII